MDSASIDSGTVTVSTSNAAVEIVVDSATVQIGSGGTLTTGGAFDNETGGTLNIESGGTLVAHDDGYWQLEGSTLVLGDGVTFTPDDFTLHGGGTSTVTVNGTDAATIGAVIEDGSGTNNIVKKGSGTLILTQANTYGGGTTVAAGVLQAQNNSALGTGAVTVDSGVTLDLSNGTTGVTVANAITISGTGSNNQGAIDASSLGPQITDLTVTGTVTLAANASVGSDNGTAGTPISSAITCTTPTRKAATSPSWVKPPTARPRAMKAWSISTVAMISTLAASRLVPSSACSTRT